MPERDFYFIEFAESDKGCLYCGREGEKRLGMFIHVKERPDPRNIKERHFLCGCCLKTLGDKFDDEKARRE